MLHIMCRGKIHGATVTEANLTYVGSITIDSTLLKAAGILPSEQVQVLNLNNGTRAATYVMEGEPNSGTICMNGPAARWAQVGDKLIIIAYSPMTPEEAGSWKPLIVFVDGKNRISSQKKN